MAELFLNLFDAPAAVAVDSEPRPRLASGKSLGLLAYLAIEGGTHSRPRLASLLWGESTDDEARSSLRQSLKRLRDELGPLIRTDRSEVELIGPCRCDVLEFFAAQDLLESRALEVRVDRFAQNLMVRNAPEFEHWVDGQYHRLRLAYQRLAQKVGLDCASRSDWVAALASADHWLTVDAGATSSMHLVMESLLMLGRGSDALARYGAFCEALRRDLECGPPPELEELASRIGLANASKRDEAPGKESEPVFESRLVGRENEWQELVRGWNRSAKYGCQVFVIEGEGGVGKTRLTDDFCRWVVADGGLVLRGRGYEAEMGMPFGPIADAFRGVLGEAGLSGTAPDFLAEASVILPELRQHFPGLPESGDERDTGRRSRLFEALAQMLLALTEDRPVAIVIDDLQWCDGETCALLHFFARRLEGSPVLLILCLTSGRMERDAMAARFCRAIKGEARTRAIDLNPFGIEDSVDLIHEMGNISTPSGGRKLASRIHEITDGNPFYTIEILKTLFADKVLAIDEASGEWVAVKGLAEKGSQRVELPRTVTEAITARIDVLQYEMRDLMAISALSGRGTDPESFAVVAGISRMRAGALAEALVEKLLLVERGGRYYAAHPIIAEAVRSSLTRSRRRQIHLAIAIATEAVTPPELRSEVAGEIARHADIAGDAKLAYRYALMASDSALARFAAGESLHWLDVAAQHAVTDEEKLEVNRRTGAQLTETASPVMEGGLARGSHGDGLRIGDVDLRTRPSRPGVS